MIHQVLRRLALLAANAMAVSLILLAGPAAVSASCVPPPSLDNAVRTAEIVFVGTVTATSNGNRWATVTVEEVWRGPDQPKTVTIKGGPAGNNTATSIDRSFEVGVRYIFLPHLDPAEGLSDNACSNTEPYAEAMGALRPADAREPIGATTTAEGGIDLGSFASLGIVGVVFLAIVLIGLVARGRQEA